MKYKDILFDADNTLFDYDLAEATALENTFTHFEGNYKSEYRPLYRKINKSLWDKLERGEIDIAKLTILRFELLFGELEIALNAEAFNAYYLDELASGAQLIDGALEIFKELSQLCKLSIVTNGVLRTQHKRIGLSPIKEYISDIFVSGDILHKKPEIEFFNFVFTKLEITDKSKVLIVGDSLVADIKGGNNAGIDTCWFNPNGLQNDTDAKVSFEIRSLREIVEIIR